MLLLCGDLTDDVIRLADPQGDAGWQHRGDHLHRVQQYGKKNPLSFRGASVVMGSAWADVCGLCSGSQDPRSLLRYISPVVGARQPCSKGNSSSNQ